MGSAIFNIVVGIALIIAATQGYSLMFTDSNVLLYVAGGIILGLGAVQVVRARKGQ